MALATVSYQSVRAAVGDPVKSLRHELYRLDLERNRHRFSLKIERNQLFQGKSSQNGGDVARIRCKIAARVTEASSGRT